MSKRDTAQHSTCPDGIDCERNGAGICALSEVLNTHRTDGIADEVNRGVIVLRTSRVRVCGGGHV